MAIRKINSRSIEDGGVASADFGGSVTSLSNSGNLTFTGTGNRIAGDFSNATVANQVLFQTSTSNSGTTLSIIPNGTGAISSFQSYGSSDPANSSVISIGIGTSGTEAVISSFTRGTGTALPLRFNTGGSERLRISTAGDVGIGTSSPATKLHVVGNSLVTTTSFFGDTSYYTALSGSNPILGFDANDYILYDRTSNFLQTVIGGTERMRIDASGNVGIGITPSVWSTSNSTKALQISSRGSIWANVNSTSINNNWYLASGDVNKYINTAAATRYVQDATGIHQWLYAASGTADATMTLAEAMRINTTGDLCVGATSSPTASTRLNVVGSGNFTMCLNSGSFNYFVGTASNQFNVYSGEGTLRGYIGTAGTWTNTSDIAFKKDIVDIRYSLQDVLNLRPVSYLTKDYDIPQIGFIAQEMEQVIPEVVSGEEGSKGISYGNITALLVKAIQELKAENDALKARLDAANL